jgi:DNA-binding transcriptional regulator YdaS (Cro superfamily)
MDNAINKAIKLAGSQSALARVVGISPQAIGLQIRAGCIHPKHCLTIEKAFPGEISRYELNPLHFGTEPKADCIVVVLQNFDSQVTTI